MHGTLQAVSNAALSTAQHASLPRNGALQPRLSRQNYHAHNFALTYLLTLNDGLEAEALV